MFRTSSSAASAFKIGVIFASATWSSSSSRVRNCIFVRWLFYDSSDLVFIFCNTRMEAKSDGRHLAPIRLIVSELKPHSRTAWQALSVDIDVSFFHTDDVPDGTWSFDFGLVSHFVGLFLLSSLSTTKMFANFVSFLPPMVFLFPSCINCS